MAKGKSVGEYSAKSTSATLSPGPGGSTITAINFEGTGNRAGLGSATIIGTGIFVGGKSGTYSGVSRQWRDQRRDRDRNL